MFRGSTPERRRRPRAVGASLREVPDGEAHVVTLRLLGPAGPRWTAICDDPLPIDARDGGAPVAVELAWADGTTTSALIGCETTRLAADAAEAGVLWPSTRRLVFGPGRPPAALSDDEPDEDLGGDPACWSDRVCEACGALIEHEPHVCPRADPG